MKSSIVPKSFVALSDFHSYEWPFKKIIDYYMDEYETIYILGDAIDRGSDGNGSFGLDLLLKIKDLSESSNGRVVYVPGNHDAFLYDYGRHNDKDAFNNMYRNGGANTIFELNEMRKEDPKRIEELLIWLGSLPLQVRHEFNGQKYALAHAFFNQRMYEKFPKLSLRSLYAQKDNKEVYNYLLDIIWFRKSKDSYNKNDVPNKDTIVVIGHTPEMYRYNENLDLKNADGETVQIHCVDGGIAYDGKMLKYDGGYSAISTYTFKHKDTSPKKDDKNKKVKENKIDMDELLRKEDLLKDVIVDTIQKEKDFATSQFKLYSFFLSGDVKNLPNDEKIRTEASQLTTEDMDALIYMYAIDRNVDVRKTSFEELYKDYVNETGLDHVIYSLVQRFDSPTAAVNQLSAAFEDGDYTYITQSVGKARDVASRLGFDGMKKVMKKRHCRGVKDYVVMKLGKEYSY